METWEQERQVWFLDLSKVNFRSTRLQLLFYCSYACSHYHVDSWLVSLNICVQESTIGAAFFTQVLSLNEATVKFDIWDTAGQERYHSLAPMYYRGAAAAIVVYDITSMVNEY